MDSSTFSFSLTGVVPAVCDAEAGEVDRLSTDAPLSQIARDRGLTDQAPVKRLFFSFAWVVG